MQLLRERPTYVMPDEQYFKDVIGKFLLWRSADRVVSALKLGGYKSQTVAYTVSIISNKLAQNMDLSAIWDSQDAGEIWEASVSKVATLVHADLIRSAGSKNVTSWAKSKACWDVIRGIDWTPPTSLVASKRSTVGRSVVKSSAQSTSLPASAAELAARAAVVGFGDVAWFELSSWAKSTNNLAPWQRGLSFSLGQVCSAGRIPTEKQATQGEKILAEASRLGFVPSSNL
jgi:hypothetical protein